MGAVIVMGALLLIAVMMGERVRPTLFIVSAAAIAYVIGLILLPVWWLFERQGWRGWRCYVPTAAGAGFLTSYLGMGGPDASWQTHLACLLSGAACAVIFSIVLSPGQERTFHTGEVHFD
jgi:hypothetical protein